MTFPRNLVQRCKEISLYNNLFVGKGFTLTLQKWNQPWWFYVADGCRLMRDIEDSIRKAGFKSVKCQSFEARNVGPFIKPHIMGYAEV